jgi:uncharacterized membrane protein YccC
MSTTMPTVTPLVAHASWPRRIRAGLPDAARMLCAAMLAYALAHALQLREAHWAVLSALITGRAQAGGTARAGVERLVATIAGAALAAGVAALHAWQIDGAVLLFAVLAPLCVLATVKPAYRTAPVAALIVLSSGLIAGSGPLGTAILRTTEIALGSLASIAVSLVVFPKRTQAKAAQHAAAILHRLAQWLRNMTHDDAPAIEKLREELRAELRELTVLAHTAGWRRRRDAHTARLLRALMALQGDVGFVARSVARKPLQIDAGSADFSALLMQIAAILDTLGGAAMAGGAVPASDELRESIKAFAAARAPGIQREVPLFLLRSLAFAVGQVIAALSPPVDAPGEKAPASSELKT